VNQVLSDLFGVGERRRGSDVTAVLLMLTVVHHEGREFGLVLAAALHILGVRDPQAFRVFKVFCDTDEKEKLYNHRRSSGVVSHGHAATEVTMF